MLCYLRHPGRALRAGERPLSAMMDFVAAQIDVSSNTTDDTGAAERSRQRHSIQCQNRLGLRPFGKRAAVELTGILLAAAIENDRLATLAELVLQTCRERRIVLPSPTALERFCADLRHQARREVYRRLSHGLSAEQRKHLDGLTERRENSGQNWLTWLRRCRKPPSPAPCSA